MQTFVYSSHCCCDRSYRQEKKRVQVSSVENELQFLTPLNQTELSFFLITWVWMEIVLLHT